MQTILSAYAGDVEVLQTENDDFNKLQTCLEVYEKASNAKVNLEKSEGLWVGSWRNRIDNPLGIKWNSTGLKILGVYLGNTDTYYRRNWTELVNTIENKIKYWSTFAPGMSYRGRILIINHLIASKLLHRLNCITPTKDTISYIQTLLLRFLWQGRHWIPVETICLPLKKVDRD